MVPGLLDVDPQAETSLNSLHKLRVSNAPFAVGVPGEGGSAEIYSRALFLPLELIPGFPCLLASVSLLPALPSSLPLLPFQKQGITFFLLPPAAYLIFLSKARLFLGL